MAPRQRGPVYMFLFILLSACLRMMMGIWNYRHTSDTVFTFRDVTDGHSQHNTFVAPLVRLVSAPNIKTGVYDNGIDSSTSMPYTSTSASTATSTATTSSTSNDQHPVINSQTNDVTDYATSQVNLEQPLASQSASTSLTNTSNLASEKNGLQQPKAIQSILQPNPRFAVRHNPDQVYIVPDLETLRLEPGERKLPTFVLLVSYARSGSTWLGSITSKAANSMYVYEPLYRILTQTYYKINEVCSFNDRCRAPTQITEKHEFAITTLYHLFTCQFRKLHRRAVSSFICNLRTTTMKYSLDSCLNSNNSYTQCLRELEETCLQTDHRILKTVRVSMELVPIMLDLWPNLKILHLSRDPRGITNSRQHAKYDFSYSRSIYSHSRALCRLMFNDTEHGKLISKTFPGRSKSLLYEALAENPIEGAKYIYDFIEANLTDETLKWIHDSSHANVKKEAYFGTQRTNSSQNAYRWRNELKFSSVQVLDKTCETVYERLGFLPLNTTDKLKSLDIPSRITKSEIDGFV